ncbi:MAG TPA: hypothetical protein PKX93_11875 [bacterium]|nr:hypothetical protein [bacterium]HOL68145.1 hypothetical protein [bacterium]HPP13335.1 hypothetical protein [bacterium]
MITDRQLWDYLDQVETLAPAEDFTLQFWQRLELRKRKRAVAWKLAPVMVVFFLVIYFHFLYWLNPADRDQEKKITLGQVREELLIEESISRLGLPDIASQVLTPEEILQTFVPEDILQHLPAVNKGGEWL